MKSVLYLLIISLALCSVSCKKYLDEPSSKSLVVPSSISDLQALLDRETIMNTICPSLAEVSADNYYLKTADFNSLTAPGRNAYIWDTAIYATTIPNEWSNAYNPVYFSNLALEVLPSFERTDACKAAWDNVKGSALLFRAKSFLQAAAIWAQAYDVSTASKELGIPLPLSSDFNQPTPRASLQETYTRITEDLKASVPLLPVTPVHVMRPSRTVAYSLLARAYLWMGAYDSCYKYADLALQLNATLVDYNTLSASATYPLDRFGPEVIMHSSVRNTYSNLATNYGKIDTLLYRSYDANDLRKTIFFKATGQDFYFKGSYARNLYFNGPATDENYLMRAECLARKGDKEGSLKDLNTLLVKRWKTGKYNTITASTAAEALSKILVERRKELLFRELRWMDVKRLNKEGAGIILKRNVSGKEYTLQPNSTGYAPPIPPAIINLSGITQNPR